MLTDDKSKITESEWEIMRVVWTLKHATSKDISEVLEAKKAWKQATTKTLIGRLVKKGMLNTKPEGKRYIYTAAVAENESLKTIRDNFYESICSKEIGKEIAAMITESILSFGDVELLEEALEKKKKEAVVEVECNCVPGQCQCKGHQHGESKGCGSKKYR